MKMSDASEMTNEQAWTELNGKMFELALECEAEKSEKRKSAVNLRQCLERRLPLKSRYLKR